MVYVRPVPNTDPNNFGTVDRTLDPSMNAATIQSNIDAAGEGGVINWAGSTHYLVNTNLRFLTGQKHYTNNGRILKCTNTASMPSFINLRAPKGGGPAAVDVTISDLEIWGHVNVPSFPPANAPEVVLLPYDGSFLRRVKFKGGSHWGIHGQIDRHEAGIVFDTCEFSYNTTQWFNGTEAGFKLVTCGVCGSPPGSAVSVLCCSVHHNRAYGLWWDIGSAGVQVLATEVNDNARTGIHWEVSGGPALFRDNHVHHNGGAGDLPPNGGSKHGFFVVSSERGEIINNDIHNNGDFGICFAQDVDPPSRSSLVCPQLAQPGANQGYMFVDWDVLGNTLSGGDTVNNQVTSNPAIHYDPTPIGETVPVTRVTETDTVQQITPSQAHVFPIPNQVLEADSALSLTSDKAAAVAQVAEVDTTSAPTAIVVQHQFPLVNVVVETDQVQTLSGFKTYSLNQIWEVDTPLALANTGSSVVDVQVVGAGFTNVQTYRKTIRTGQIVK